MRGFDLSSWEGFLGAVAGIALITLVGVGLRLLVMLTIQQRQQAANRQINERLRTLIAAYKTLGGSFTGNLQVDPTHLRELRRRAKETSEHTETPSGATLPGEGGVIPPDAVDPSTGERARRIRDAVESALSDILLLGTESQVRLAATAANELVEGRPIHTAELVVSLRSFIREVLDLDAVPHGLAIPPQGPTRPASGGGKGGDRDSSRGGSQDGGRQGGRGGGGGGAGGAGGGAAGAGMGAGLSMAAGSEGER